ncbi:hypothetical protein KP509_02G046400 [Ceratopteris richardii]|uniref:Photosystem I assembly protein Ycf4 n=1 Tax=Ceratopteris richardii TaxID=49495 RepID=A0A8T2V9B6_CERRI|nr:hypothetical protein KP509_02G046400 [Ceratopteris richardii]
MSSRSKWVQVEFIKGSRTFANFFIGKDLIPNISSKQIAFIPQGLQEGISYVFRWGFPGKNRSICIQLLLKDIEAVGLKTQEGLFSSRILYLKVRGQRSIPLTRIGENFTLDNLEKEAAELARFLRVSIEGF